MKKKKKKYGYLPHKCKIKEDEITIDFSDLKKVLKELGMLKK